MTAGACVSAWADGPSGIGLGRTAAGVGAVAMTVLQGKVIAEWFTGALFMIGISVSVCAYPIGIGLAQLVLPSMLAAFGLHAALLTDAVPAGLALVLFLAVTAHRRMRAAMPRRFSLPSGRGVPAGRGRRRRLDGLHRRLRRLRLLSAEQPVPARLWPGGHRPGHDHRHLGQCAGTLTGGGLAARFGGFNIFLVGTLALAIGMAGSALTGWPIAWAVLVGVVGSIQPGVTMAVGTLSARPENRAVGMGLFYTLYYLGGTFAPALCGMVADYSGRPEGGLLAAAAMSALAIPLFMLHRALVPHATMLVRA